MEDVFLRALKTGRDAFNEKSFVRGLVRENLNKALAAIDTYTSAAFLVDFLDDEKRARAAIRLKQLNLYYTLVSVEVAQTGWPVRICHGPLVGDYTTYDTVKVITIERGDQALFNALVDVLRSERVAGVLKAPAYFLEESEEGENFVADR
jgi:hypothetical protein